MTAMEVIHEINREMPSSDSPRMQKKWLAILDQQVLEEILTLCAVPKRHIPDEVDEEDGDREVLIPDSHRQVYHHWMEMRVHHRNGEVDRYNNAVTNFNNAYDAFRNYWVRTHMPKGRRRKFF